MGRENNITGRIGEEAAAAFLRKNGYRILERNLRTPFGELDIVARKYKITVFVEVKSRATSSLGPPYLSVTYDKRLHLLKNALAYLKRRRLLDSDWRIDVVSVKLDMNYKVENIELIENVVEEEL